MKRYIQTITISLLAIVLGGFVGCVGPMTDAPPAPDKEKRVFTVAELDAQAAIPLNVAVYFTPRVLGRAAITDLRQNKPVAGGVVHSGQIGAATVATITHYFPLVFDNVYVITHFPDSRLIKHKIDIVITIDDMTAVRWPATLSPEIWDNRLHIGLYHPDGTEISHYAVTTSSEVELISKTASPDVLLQWVYHHSQEALKPVIRQTLWQFPRQKVLNAVRDYATKSHKKLSSAEWQQRQQEFLSHLAKEKLSTPLPTTTLEQTLTRQTKDAADIMVMSNALVLLNTNIFAQFYSRNPTPFNQDITNQTELSHPLKTIFLQQLSDFAEEHNLNHRPFVFKHIGGQHKSTKVQSTKKPSPLPQPKPTPLPTSSISDTVPTGTTDVLHKTYSILAELNHAGKPRSDNASGDCLTDLRQVKETLLSHAKQAGANTQLVHSAGSGAKVYSKDHCASPIATTMNPSQASLESQRLTICGVQTVNCTLAKVFSGTECQLALKQCRQESPLPMK